MRPRLLPLAALLLLLLSSPGVRAAGARVAIVMDDLGYRYAEGLRTLELPGPVSFAVLPFTPYSRTVARIAHSLGRDVLVHMPMQAQSNKTLGPGGLLVNMDQREFTQQVRAALRAVPNARGLSNHMGSLLTAQPQAMNWLMQALKQEPQLFFFDSRTTALTQGTRAADANNLPNTSRDVFLDNILDEAAIDKQFDLLLKKARLNGTAVAIGHPNPETLKVLENRLPELKSQGVHLVSLSELIQQRQRPAAQAQVVVFNNSR